MYACELVQALREALDGGRGNHNENGGLNAGAAASASASAIESSKEVQALRAKIAGDAALRENFAEMFGGGGGGGGDDDNDDDADEQ